MALDSDSEQTRDAIIAAGTLPLLVALLRSDNSGLHQQAADALLSLAEGSQQNKDAIIAAGVVPLLVALLRSDKPAVHQPAAGALMSLTGGSQRNNAIIAAGAVPLLVAFCFQTARLCKSLQQVLCGILHIRQGTP